MPALAYRVVLLVALATGCMTVAPLPAAQPELPLEAWEQAAARPSSAVGDPGTLPEDAGTPSDLAKTVPGTPKARATPAPAHSAGSPTPGGAVCLAELAARGVRFSKSAPVLGIATPIVVEGPLGGIPYYTLEKKPMVADCRLALSLVDLAPELSALGVDRVRFSSTYVYRTSHPGRMSMHAYGLAIDVHALRIRGVELQVKSAFSRGQGLACADGMQPLNLVLCRVRAHAAFKELLGPDDNAAHRDHFHLGLKPLPGELAADLPWPTKASAKTRSSRARSAR